MPEPRDPALSVRFETLNRTVTTISSYSIESSYLTSTDGFEFTYYDEPRSKMFGLELEPVELLINGASQVLGRVDQTDIGDNGSAVTCRGRDYIADIVECNVDPTLAIKRGAKLFDAVLTAAAPVGITSVISDGDVSMRDVRTGAGVGGSKSPDFRQVAQEDIKPKPNEGIYEFINRLVSRHGCTIQPGPDRQTLVLAAPNYSQLSAYAIRRTDNQPNSIANNVVSATCTRDFSSFPTYVLFFGKGGSPGEQQHDNTIKFELEGNWGNEMDRIFAGKLVRGRRKPTDRGALKAGQLYRLLYLRDEESRNRDQLLHAALRATSERLKDVLQYQVTLRGHEDPQTGALWSVDTIVDVNDDICNVHERLWIESRTFRYSAGEGATTELKCWRSGVFML
jgi:hypothetical protein